MVSFTRARRRFAGALATRVGLAVTVAIGLLTPARAADLHAAFDRILDVYVRDGFVYYKALQMERRALDLYVRALDVPAAEVAAWPKDQQVAFWLNAYNAAVLATVIDKYPIRGTAPDYPLGSVRQIPGGFDQRVFALGGRQVTLDAIEKAILLPMGDARVLLAMGRGAIGGGRLKSEAYHPDRLNEQLDTAVKEFVTRTACFNVDRTANTLVVSPLFGWRQDAFVASFQKAGERWVSRSPIEQALLGMAAPWLFPSEREFLVQNTFQLSYGAFDWRLNDLTGGRPN